MESAVVSTRPLASSESGSSFAGDFAPGDVLIGRYRIIALLGEGGMGQVYLADDLTLDQPVAIKFLPQKIARLEGGQERFRAEVRLARRVTHSNVARVHDIGEVDGQHFLTMEFVDGEDLARLLKRIGRLPPEKANDIAQQLCSGLAAAHEKGVLHRDLKPANVMLDGDGRVKITDFGLAAIAAEQSGERDIVGTLPYMAPEQLKGSEATQRSEVYSLGLLLYELFTGRRAIDGQGFAEILRQHQKDTPRSPSDVVRDIDPAVEGAIQRCLEKDPARRPESVRAVALALPGGDPLAAAVAAGETPAPALVAEAGEAGGLSVPAALAWLAAFVAVLLTVAALAGRTRLVGVAPLENPPAALEARARDVLRAVGFEVEPGDRLARFVRDGGYLEHLAALDDPSQRRARLATGRPPAIRFLYRQSPVALGRRALSPAFGLGVAQADRFGDPPLDVPGMARVVLDPGGELLALWIVPPVDPPESPAPELDWGILFAASGLDPTAFRPATPRGPLGVEADERLAWEGPYPGADLVARVEAGTSHGRPIAWQVQLPWQQPTGKPPGRDLPAVFVALFLRVMIAVWSIAAVLARRNLVEERADRRGAFRISTAMFAAALIAWLLGEEHVGGLHALAQFLGAVAEGCFLALFTWVFYLALEPPVRRLYPHRLTSWIRFLEGRLRDPLVGRDLLIGATLGAGLLLAGDLGSLLGTGLSGPTIESSGTLFVLLGGRHQLAYVAGSLTSSVTFILLMVVLLVLLRLLLRRPSLAAAGFMAVNLFMSLPNLGDPVSAALLVIYYSTLLFAFLRFGPLTLMVVGILPVLLSAPLTLDGSRWYVQISTLTLVLCTAIAALGFWGALAGRRILGAPTRD